MNNHKPSKNDISMNERKFNSIFSKYRSNRSSGKNMTDIQKRIKDFAVNYRNEITRLTTIVGVLGGFPETSFDAGAGGKYAEYVGLDKYDLAFGNNILFDSDHPYNHAQWVKDSERFKTKALKNAPGATANKNIITWKTINPFVDNIGSPQSLVEFFFNMMMAYRADLLSTRESSGSKGVANWYIPLPTEWTESGGILDKMMKDNANRTRLKNFGIEVSHMTPNFVPNASYYTYEGNHRGDRKVCFDNGGIIIPYFLPVDISKDLWHKIYDNVSENDVFKDVFNGMSIFHNVNTQAPVESGCIPIYINDTVESNPITQEGFKISPISAYITHKTRLLYDIIYSQGIYNPLDPTTYGSPGKKAGDPLREPKSGGFVNNNGILININDNQIDNAAGNFNYLPSEMASRDKTIVNREPPPGKFFNRYMYKRWDTGRSFYNTMIMRHITDPLSFIGNEQPNLNNIDTTASLIRIFDVQINQSKVSKFNENEKLNLFLFNNGLYDGTLSDIGEPRQINDWAIFDQPSNPIGLFSVYNFRTKPIDDTINSNSLIQAETLLTAVQISQIVNNFSDIIFNNIDPNHYYSGLSPPEQGAYKTKFQRRLVASVLTVKESLFMNDISQLPKFASINTYKDVTSPLYDQTSHGVGPTTKADDREKYEKRGQYIPVASTENFRQAFIQMMNKAILTVQAEKYAWDEVDKTKYNPTDFTQVATSYGGDLSKLVKLDVSSILEMPVTEHTSFIHYLQECLDSKKSLVNGISEKGVDVGGLLQDGSLKETVVNMKNYLRTTQIKKTDILEKLNNIESKYLAHGETELTAERLKEIGEIETMLNENILAKIRTGQFIEKSTINNYVRLILERVRDILQVYVNEEKRLADEIKVRQTQLRTGYAALKTDTSAPNVARRRSIEELKTVVSETRALTEQMNLNKSKATHYVEELIEKLLELRKPVPGTPPTADREVAIIVGSVIDKIWEMTRKAGIHRRIRVANINTKLENIYYFLEKIRDSVNFNIGGPQIARRMSGESNLDSVGIWVLYQNVGMTHMFDLLTGRRVKNIQLKSTIDKLYEDDKLYGVIIGQTAASRTKQPDTLYYVSRTPPENVSYRTEDGRRALITYMKQFFTGYGTKMGFWERMTDGRRDKIMANLGCGGGMIASCSEIFKTKEDVQAKLEELIDLKAITADTKLVIGGGGGVKRRVKRKSLVYVGKRGGKKVNGGGRKKKTVGKGKGKKVKAKKVKTMKKKRSVGKSVLKRMKKLLFS